MRAATPTALVCIYVSPRAVIERYVLGFRHPRGGALCVAVFNRVDLGGEHLPIIEGLFPRLSEADLRIPAETHVPGATAQRISKHPTLGAARRNTEEQVAAVVVKPNLLETVQPRCGEPVNPSHVPFPAHVWKLGVGISWRTVKHSSKQTTPINKGENSAQANMDRPW